MSDLELRALGSSPWPGFNREATAEDLVTYLQARPDVAVQVFATLRTAKIATRWDVRPDLAWRRDITGRAALEVMEGIDGWCVYEPDGAVAIGQAHGTREEAMAAADRELVERGWALVGGAHQIATPAMEGA